MFPRPAPSTPSLHLICSCSLITVGDSLKSVIHRYQQTLGGFLDDALPGLCCSHIHYLFVLRAVCLQSGLQQVKHMLSWIKVSDRLGQSRTFGNVSIQTPWFPPRRVQDYIPSKLFPKWVTMDKNSSECCNVNTRKHISVCVRCCRKYCCCASDPRLSDGSIL